MFWLSSLSHLYRSDVLEAMGQHPTEEELFQLLSSADEDGTGAIDFSEFLHIIENQKERAQV